MVISNNDVSTLQVVIPLGYGTIDAIGLLFSSTLLILGFCEGVSQKCYGKLCASIGVDNVPLVRVG